MPQTVDASIPLAVSPPQGLGSGGLLPTLGQFATIQNSLNQNRLFQQTFAAKQRAGQIIAGAPDLETGIKALYADPNVSPFAPEIVSNIRQGMLAQTQQAGALQQQGTDALTGFLKAAPGAIANPQAFDAMANAYLASVNPQVRGHVQDAIASVRASLTDGLPSDPLAAHAELGKRFAGLATSAGVSPDVFSLAAGKPTTLDTGGTIQPGMVSQTTGGFTPSGLGVSKTLAPQVVQLNTPGGGQQPTLIGGGTGAGAPAGGHALLPGTGGTPGTSLGLPSPTQTQTNYNTGRGKDMADYQQSLDQTVKSGGQLLQNVQEARDALKSFAPGGGASVYARVGQIAQGLGADPALVDKISNGDLSASQEFNKLMVNNVMNQIKTQIPEGSRMAVKEFDAFKENNPNIDTDPRAIDKIFNYWGKQYQMFQGEQQGLNGFLAHGGNISEWPAKWQELAQAKGYFTPAAQTTAPGAGVTHTWTPGKGLTAVPTAGGTP